MLTVVSGVSPKDAIHQAPSSRSAGCPRVRKHAAGVVVGGAVDRERTSDDHRAVPARVAVEQAAYGSDTKHACVVLG